MSLNFDNPILNQVPPLKKLVNGLGLIIDVKLLRIVVEQNEMLIKMNSHFRPFIKKYNNINKPLKVWIVVKTIIVQMII